eukprot:6095691-Pyramimonas_sp.AAC.1
MRGARVIVLREGQSTAEAETYIRKEDGEREEDGPRADVLTESQSSCPALNADKVVARAAVRMYQAGITGTSTS